MKSLFVLILLIAAYCTMSAIAGGIQVTWAPLTSDFKLISFSFPLDMQIFPADRQGNDYTIIPNFEGIEFNGKITIDTYSTASVLGQSQPETGTKSFNFDSSHIEPGSYTPFDVSFLPFDPKSEVSTHERLIIFYLRVASFSTPSVALTILSKRGGGQNDVDQHAAKLVYPSLGSLVIEAPVTKEPTNEFTFTLDKFAPISSQAAFFEIRSSFRSAIPFALVPNMENSVICTVNGRPVKSRLYYDAIQLPTKKALFSGETTLVIKCPSINLAPTCERAFVATWHSVDRHQHSAITQTVPNPSCLIGAEESIAAQAYKSNKKSIIDGITVVIVIAALTILYFLYASSGKLPQQSQNATSTAQYGTMSTAATPAAPAARAAPASTRSQRKR